MLNFIGLALTGLMILPIESPLYYFYILCIIFPNFPLCFGTHLHVKNQGQVRILVVTEFQFQLEFIQIRSISMENNIILEYKCKT